MEVSSWENNTVKYSCGIFQKAIFEDPGCPKVLKRPLSMALFGLNRTAKKSRTVNWFLWWNQWSATVTKPDPPNSAMMLWDLFYKISRVLAGGIPTPLKNMSSSDWIIIPTTGENKKCSKPATSIPVHMYSGPKQYMLVGLVKHYVEDFWSQNWSTINPGASCWQYDDLSGE